MDVGSIMTTRVVSVEMDDRLDVVKKIFDTLKFHHLLVVDTGGKLKGVVSDRDLLRALSPYVGSAAENARDIPRAANLLYSDHRRDAKAEGHSQLARCPQDAAPRAECRRELIARAFGAIVAWPCQADAPP
jgi:CBS domain-containing protein